MSGSEVVVKSNCEDRRCGKDDSFRVWLHLPHIYPTDTFLRLCNTGRLETVLMVCGMRSRVCNLRLPISSWAKKVGNYKLCGRHYLSFFLWEAQSFFMFLRCFLHVYVSEIIPPMCCTDAWGTLQHQTSLLLALLFHNIEFGCLMSKVLILKKMPPILDLCLY